MQRVRDPIYDLIRFDVDRSLADKAAWEIVQSPVFNRLRRVRQLGFSELVYPSATHSRFAHSLGVYHTAKQLLKVINEKAGGPPDYERENRASIAALVHDIGHGPFSHSFEAVGKRLGLAIEDHETLTDHFIRNGVIADILTRAFSKGFVDEVADIIRKDGRKTVHNAVVTSQFDADRLDYIRRDRLMSGSQHSAIDFPWLIANLEIGDVENVIDDQTLPEKIPTFVIAPKAVYAAEAYVLGLFQLYPTLYFHKATRGAEKLFTELVVRIVELCKHDLLEKTGLPHNHALAQFGKDPDDFASAMRLDDATIWGSLPLMMDAEDLLISEYSRRLAERKLLKSYDFRAQVASKIDPKELHSEDLIKEIDEVCASIGRRLDAMEPSSEEQTLPIVDARPRFIRDSAVRPPYKQYDKTRGPLDQIYVWTEGGKLIDLKERSDVVRALKPFKLSRVYFSRDDKDAEREVEQIVAEEIQNARC